jgi:hypothetical protein
LKHFSFCKKLLKTSIVSIAISTKIGIATIKCNQKNFTIAATVAIVNYNAIAIVARFSNCSIINTINLRKRSGGGGDSLHYQHKYNTSPFSSLSLKPQG